VILMIEPPEHRLHIFPQHMLIVSPFKDREISPAAKITGIAGDHFANFSKVLCFQGLAPVLDMPVKSRGKGYQVTIPIVFQTLLQAFPAVKVVVYNLRHLRKNISGSIPEVEIYVNNKDLVDELFAAQFFHGYRHVVKPAVAPAKSLLA